MATKSVNLHATISPAQWDYLERAAKQKEVTVSEIVRRLIQKRIDNPARERMESK